MNRYPRNMQGYGVFTPEARWPGEALIAVQFVVNYEEGSENAVIHGDAASESFLSEIIGAQAWPKQRHWNMESLYEYGSRAGFWRLYRLFTQAKIPVTVFGVATALARSPTQVAAMQDADWEIASHGLKWIDYKDHTREQERSDIQTAMRLHEEITGTRPTGWYTGRCSMNTVDLVADAGGFIYQSDCYADDLPYWQETKAGPQLMIPYALDTNDMRFATAQGFNAGDQFFTYLKDSFDALYEEGREGSPKMLNIGLHSRLVGRPGRIQALKRFIDYIKTHDRVWFARRIEIANHWRNLYPVSDGIRLQPSRMAHPDFIKHFGGVFEHSAWIAEEAFALELGPAHDTAIGLHAALVRVFRRADDTKKEAVLKAHPDLGNRLNAVQTLTSESKAEQAAAGLSTLLSEEQEILIKLNKDYTEKFDFPFIVAVKTLTKNDIFTMFQKRIANSRETEFNEACRQVEKIALLRLHDLLP